MGSLSSDPLSPRTGRPHTLNSTSMSKAYQSTFTGETNTPYSKQFVHSKSSQYRRLKTEWKNNVYLARSRIQGLGLYAAKDIEKHTMVIEYIGTIIRNEVANRREKIYEEQVGIQWDVRGSLVGCGGLGAPTDTLFSRARTAASTCSASTTSTSLTPR